MNEYLLTVVTGYKNHTLGILDNSNWNRKYIKI